MSWQALATLTAGSSIIGALIAQHVTPQDVRAAIRRRVMRMFGVTGEPEPRAQRRKYRDAPLSSDAAYPEAKSSVEANAPAARRQALLDGIAQEGREAMRRFGELGLLPTGGLPVEQFRAPTDSPLFMAPRSAAIAVRRSAGQVEHDLKDAPLPIRFLADMLTEGVEYRLSKRAGRLYLTAMGEVAPAVGPALSAPAAPQIGDQSIPPPGMGDEDTPRHDLYKTGDLDAPSVILDRNGEVALGLCRRCGRGEADLGEACTPQRGFSFAPVEPGCDTPPVHTSNA